MRCRRLIAVVVSFAMALSSMPTQAIAEAVTLAEVPVEEEATTLTEEFSPDEELDLVEEVEAEAAVEPEDEVNPPEEPEVAEEPLAEQPPTESEPKAEPEPEPIPVEDPVPTDEPDALEPQAEPLYVEEGIPVMEGEPMLGTALELTDPAEYDALTSQAVISYSQPAQPSQQQIRDFIASHPFDMTAADTYDVQPVTSAPYAAGQLSSASKQNALNFLNTLRYIAGVDANITINTSYESYAQAAALVNCINGGISHNPTMPSGMDASLYAIGYVGANESNLAYGAANAAASIQLYFDDLGDNNHGVAGHRRWLTSSKMGRTAFGQVGSFNATYVKDESGSSYVTDVAWPARQMPTSFFSKDAQWSFSTVTQNIGSASSIRVKVVRRRDGKTWNLSSSDITVNVVEEYGTFIGYDKNGCIVWDMPDVGGYHDGDVFDVTISGDVSRKQYSVEFFDLIDVDSVSIEEWDTAEQIANGGSYTTTNGFASMSFCFIPGVSNAAYPSDPTLQRLVEPTVYATTATLSSSNPRVATVAPDGDHSSAYVFEDGSRIYADWRAIVTIVGTGTTTITCTLSNGRTASFDLVVVNKSVNPDVDLNTSITSFGAKFVYSGSEQHPTYYVLYGRDYDRHALVEGTDYTITYKDNVNVGTATATIQGINGYEGTVVQEFTIDPAPIATASVIIPDQTYTGSALEPKPTVTRNNAPALKEGTDYTLAYEDNVNVGEATIVLTGKGNYTGTARAHFTITPVILSSASTSVSFAPQAYTGSALEPVPTVTVNGRKLVAGTDFIVSYALNTEVGTASATITGVGNYRNSVSSEFVIGPASLASATIAKVADQSYTGVAITPEPRVTLASKPLVKGTDYTVAYSENTNVGTATITIKGMGNYTGARSTSFKIVGASLSGATVAPIESQVYAGKPVTPKPVVTLGGKTLAEGTDYTLGYAGNDKPGTGTVTVTGTGNYTGTAKATFTIDRFPDVLRGKWYYAVVNRAADLGLVSGFADGTFGPDKQVTRGQVAVMLWNMAGRPAPVGTPKSFPDVKAGAYYYNAVRWASSVGVVNGFGDGTFGPGEDVTREQLATMLANYARRIGGLTVTGSAADFASMSDAGKVSGYAQLAVGWCFRNKVISGKSGNLIDPQGTASRAETAKMVVFVYDMLQ